MPNNKKNILFVHYGDNWLRGSEMCLIHLLKHLDQDRFVPFLWTNSLALHTHSLEQNIASQHSEFSLLAGWNQPRCDVKGWYHLVQQGLALLHRYNIDLIHVNSGAPCQWMCLAARLYNIPLITQLHSDYPLRDRMSLGLHFSPSIICVSKAISRNLINDGYPPERISVIHHGIEPAMSKPSFNLRDKLHLKSDDFILATVGSLIERKGIDRLISAVKYLEYHYPKLHLIIIGDGEMRDMLHQQVSTLNLIKRIHFTGEQSNVAHWLSGGVDAFISGARAEAFGLVLGEAALASLPIIAPNTGGIPEFITHNQTGILYENDHDGVAPIVQAIKNLMEDELLRQSIGINAYDFVSSHLTVERNTQAIESLYQQKLDQIEHNDIPLADGFKPLKHLFRYVPLTGGHHG